MDEENKFIGKKIKLEWDGSRYYYKEDYEDFDDEPILRLEMEDGSIFEVIANYGGYTGNSEDEYLRFIKVKELKQKKEKGK